MDYFFMSKEDEAASSNPILVIADERTGSRMARLTGRKRLCEYGEMDWLLEELSKTLKGWGHTGGPGSEIIMKTDGEPAIVALRDALLKYHGGIGIPEQPEKGDKTENGYI